MEQMRRRIENPQVRLNLREADTPRDLALAHENEAATVYVKWLMGEKDFLEFTRTVCGARWDAAPNGPTYCRLDVRHQGAHNDGLESFQ